MSLRQELYEAILSNFKEKVRCDPDADFTQEIQSLAAEFIEMEKEREHIVIFNLRVIADEVGAPLRDIIKEEFSRILAECDRLEAADEEE